MGVDVLPFPFRENLSFIFEAAFGNRIDQTIVIFEKGSSLVITIFDVSFTESFRGEKLCPFHRLVQMMGLIRSFLGAMVFYTIIPVPSSWGADFDRIARWIPVIGIILGLLLSLAGWGLTLIGMPIFTRSVVIVCLWVAITGGLHLDGVSDTADGLAVTDGEKRLGVMSDSVTGAFGVMATALLLCLKISSLTDIGNDYFLLCSALGWGRWGQVMAIALYPYLKASGKGAFHKKFLQVPQDCVFGLVILLLWTALRPTLSGLAVAVIGVFVALGVGYWFARRLGGHTGDTYGAVVEWSEAICLCLFTLLSS